MKSQLQILFSILLSLLPSSVLAGSGSGSGDLEKQPDFRCFDPDLQDSQLVADFFQVGSDGTWIRLSVPTGESSAQDANGTCEKVFADELFYQCRVLDESQKINYAVDLYSNGTEELFARFQNLDEPKSDAIIVPCEQL